MKGSSKEKQTRRASKAIGAAKTNPNKPGKALQEFLAAIDETYALIEADVEAGKATGERVEDGLYWYFNSSVRVGLFWINGNLDFRFPDEYVALDTRLPKMCKWLAEVIARDDTAELRQTRREQLEVLYEIWPSYKRKCTSYLECFGQPGEAREIAYAYTWQGIDTLWHGPVGELGKIEGDPRAPIAFLPVFQSPESEEFHLACLSILFLNRACRVKLTDLNQYGW